MTERNKYADAECYYYKVEDEISLLV